MKKGDIVLVRFPFTDLSGEKVRPALVLTSENKEGDLLLAFLRKHLCEKEHSIAILAEQGTGLKKESLLRLDKMTTLNKRIILGRIGSLSAHKLSEVDQKLKSLLLL